MHLWLGDIASTGEQGNAEFAANSFDHPDQRVLLDPHLDSAGLQGPQILAIDSRVVGDHRGRIEPCRQALVFGLAQYGELFIASLAAWIGVCSFAARGRRNLASYGFQLAGYTAAIVGVPAALNTDGAYNLIVARSTEIILGIVCMGVVSRLIFPSELAPRLISLTGQAFQRVDRFAELALDPATSPERLASEREALAKDFGAVETMRSSAFFENAEARRMDRPLRDAVYAAVDLYALAEALAARPGPDMEGSLNPESSIANANRALSQGRETVTALRQRAAKRALTRARDRLDARVAALAKGETLSKSIPSANLWSDPLTAVLTGIRSALAVAITAAFWFVTAWPSGPIAVMSQVLFARCSRRSNSRRK